MSNNDLPEGFTKDLTGIEILAEASLEKLRELEDSCTWHTYQAGETIIDRDDESSDIFFIVTGKVKVLDHMANDQEIALAEIGPGRSFGELSAMDANKRSARVTALEKTTLAALSRKKFRKLILDCPEIGLMLLKRFATVIRNLNSRVTALSALTPHQRVYYELLRMSEPNPEGNGTWVIQHVPKHEEIASWSGTESTDVASAIGHLAREGVVGRKNKSLIIKDHARLQMLVNLS
ncbi:MAG: Crp/Fnr family transcriptional regulator [Rhodospirillaceae bacterium]|nr:Crp/Fnr family transcriptional regulator [Rhodospirillaceae bacterium]MBT5659535.1 Crp/Fnr family transcriptional regulator [Rhodospirillaceae bacterium]MBT5751802.1 Crp/Fnr family transcriptional regulator [Rhodospirillaceae bacterium]